ncbi:hypothetical protein EDE15_3275 [Edaphobacter aggregans]|uniref:Uncharacterized protein n=1 Tax=Edaphobacter aggregans TaxID=570835 RepID=A0A428MLI5_9BACT|nr:hypothetical protein [Edaphobacter aggregans]RSL17732.1 hypothetical protein EDE15_3275 [Edaphobacter aggregans]
MNDARDKKFPEVDTGLFMRGELPGMDSAARSSIVNRTHRVVRERATKMAARRNRARSLWVPMAVCSALVVMICTAGWSVLDEYDAAPTGVPDSSDQFLVLALWFFPVSMALLAMVWFRRTRNRSGREAM